MGISANHLVDNFSWNYWYVCFKGMYDWFNYYYALVNKDLDSWLDTGPILPVSINNKSRDEQKRILNISTSIKKACLPAIISGETCFCILCYFRSFFSGQHPPDPSLSSRLARLFLRNSVFSMLCILANSLCIQQSKLVFLVQS